MDAFDMKMLKKCDYDEFIYGAKQYQRTHKKENIRGNPLQNRKSGTRTQKLQIPNRLLN